MTFYELPFFPSYSISLRPLNLLQLNIMDSDNMSGGSSDLEPDSLCEAMENLGASGTDSDEDVTLEETPVFTDSSAGKITTPPQPKPRTSKMSRESSDPNPVSFFVELGSSQPQPGCRRRSLPTRKEEELTLYFEKIKRLMSSIEGEVTSRMEVNRRKVIAKNILNILTEEEEKILNGAMDISNIDDISAESLSKQDMHHRPALRRERTFDLTPRINELNVVDISLEDEEQSGMMMVDNRKNPNRQPSSSSTLLSKVFQEIKEAHVKVLSKEINRLEAIERELAIKASFCGPERIRCWEDIKGDHAAMTSSCLVTQKEQQSRPVPRPRTKLPIRVNNVTLPSKFDVSTPQRPIRKCDTALSRSCYETLESDKNASNLRTTLADASKTNGGMFQVHVVDDLETIKKPRSRVSSAGSSCSWFIPNDNEELEVHAEHHGNGVEEKANGDNLGPDDNGNGRSLLRSYRDKKSGKDKNKAFFISCGGDDDDDDNSRVKTRMIDLKRSTSESAGNVSLQDALRMRRPDYISSTRSRETHLLAHRQVSKDRSAILENIPTTPRQPKVRQSAPKAAEVASSPPQEKMFISRENVQASNGVGKEKGNAKAKTASVSSFSTKIKSHPSKQNSLSTSKTNGKVTDSARSTAPKKIARKPKYESPYSQSLLSSYSGSTTSTNKSKSNMQIKGMPKITLHKSTPGHQIKS